MSRDIDPPFCTLSLVQMKFGVKVKVDTQGKIEESVGLPSDHKYTSNKPSIEEEV